MSFTPGPWETTATSDGVQVICRKGTNHFIAETGTLSPSGADARLITAAPDLYAACKAIAAFHAQCFVGLPLAINGAPIDHTLLNEACALAQRAIAKADGR